MTIRAGTGKTRATTGSAAHNEGPLTKVLRTFSAVKGRAPGGVAIAALLLLGLGACGLTPPGGGDLALWRIVDGACNGSDAKSSPEAAGAIAHGTVQCRRTQGYAVLKDRCGAAHYLVVPTARRTGVESPELLALDQPNYLALAWAERGRSLAAQADSGAALGDIGLAVNSRFGRSQSQLHIHVDRIDPSVLAALRALPAQSAHEVRIVLRGHRYRVEDLAALPADLWARVSQQWGAQDQEARAHLTLAVADDGRGGYFVVSGWADPVALDRGHAEELMVSRMCGADTAAASNAGSRP
jgi:CDP-diacylglycerol pyrophosphatase